MFYKFVFFCFFILLPYSSRVKNGCDSDCSPWTLCLHVSRFLSVLWNDSILLWHVDASSFISSAVIAVLKSLLAYRAPLSALRVRPGVKYLQATTALFTDCDAWPG